MAMTEEQKQKMKEGRERAAAKKKAVQEVTEVKVETVKAEEAVAIEKEEPKSEQSTGYTMEQVQQMIADAVQQAVASLPTKSVEPQIIRVASDAPIVKLRFQCECSPVNVITFGMNGKFGSITGKSGTFSVPKESFAGEFRDELVQNLLASRELIVLDGLTDEERELYGVNYKQGELMDEKMFAKIIDMGAEILDVYKQLGLTYKEAVARRFAEEFEKNPSRIGRDLITKLNELSKKDYAALPKEDMRRKGAFYSIIEQMNKKDAAD